ncbi:MAG: dioxygenase [Vicinamibacteraceae bacterium]|nr:dioxygenase [Vicinamibacteraceae bacterium]
MGLLVDFQRRRLSARAPALFLGFPTPALAHDADYTTALRRFGAQLRPPRGVVAVSARWQVPGPVRVAGRHVPEVAPAPAGTPAPMRGARRELPQDADLAIRVVSLLEAEGETAVVDPDPRADYAVWTPLSLTFDADRLPIVSVSLPLGSTPHSALTMGRALAPLRADGILLAGVGAVACNLHRVHRDENAWPEPAARLFDDWVADRLSALDVESLLDYRQRGPQAHAAAPTGVWLDPLFFVLGARLTGDRVHPLTEGFKAGTLSARSFVLAGRRSEDLRLPDELAREPASR